MLLTREASAHIFHDITAYYFEFQHRSQSMPVRKKKAKKHVNKAQFEKQLRLINQEVKKLDARIKDLNRTLDQGAHRIL
jgi:predicted  nucleic acid-binding Zn-ribbon protein